mmetsp:Transcript_11045/g.23447  ORF Transcript_11045/g.23447 Transcript_11045/m.23447 type:complete len:227 (+) Transcript_11045:33-713(+)
MMFTLLLARHISNPGITSIVSRRSIITLATATTNLRSIRPHPHHRSPCPPKATTLSFPTSSLANNTTTTVRNYGKKNAKPTLAIMTMGKKKKSKHSRGKKPKQQPQQQQRRRFHADAAFSHQTTHQTMRRPSDQLQNRIRQNPLLLDGRRSLRTEEDQDHPHRPPRHFQIAHLRTRSSVESRGKGRVRHTHGERGEEIGVVERGVWEGREWERGGSVSAAVGGEED